MTYWFDPMVNTVGMPNNPGPGGNNLAATQAMNNQTAANNAYVAAQNQAALYAAKPTPYGYGFVGGYPSFGPAAAPGTYSPGSGRSSFSGVSLGTPAPAAPAPAAPAPAAPAPAADPWATGASPFEGYGLPGGGGAGSFSPSPNYPGGVALSPLASYQGTGYNPFDLSIYSPAAQGNVGGSQPRAAAPSQDFLLQDSGEGLENIGVPQGSFPRAKEDFNDWFNGLGGQSRGIQGGWEQSYYEQNPDIWNAAIKSGRGLDAFAQEHANIYGGAEGRQLFDAVKYLQNNPDVAASGMGAWQHYDRFGRDEGREKTLGNVFDPATYLQNNQDVAAAGVDPRTHWLQFGQKEGRQGGGVVAASRDNIARALMQGTPSGAVLGMTGPGGRNYGDWNPMTAPGSDLSRQRLVNRGNAVDMPSGQIGGPSPPTYGVNLPRDTLSVPKDSIYQDPFGAYVPSIVQDGGFPGNYAPRFDIPPGGGWLQGGA